MEKILGFLRSIWDSLKWSLTTFRFTDALDVLVVAFLIFEFMLWIKRSRTKTLLKGFLMLLLVWLTAELFSLNMTSFAIEKAFSVGIIALVILFQPELRRGLEKLGNSEIFRKLFPSAQEAKSELSKESAEAIAQALKRMSMVKTGALICVECTNSLKETGALTGTELDASLSDSLLINIFEKNTPLHDGAVIVRNNRIWKAGVILPLTEQTNLNKELGTRHRAALGLSEVSDAKVFVVSEETGAISMAQNGQLYRSVDDEFLRYNLLGDTAPQRNYRDSLRGVLHHGRGTKQ